MAQSAVPGKPVKRLGDFEVLRELGRGGMGVVYEARQVSLNRKVALKVLAGSLGLTTKAVIRFKREAEAAAKLHHTNIVPIYATGDDEGTHYYAMELIEGPGLNQVLDRLRADQNHPTGSAPANATSTDATTADATTVDAPGAPDWAVQTIGYEAPGTNAGSSAASSSSSSLQGGGGYFDRVAGMMAEVADALDYAHAHGVVHRDIKPSNLLLSPDGRLHMNDFGLARMLEQPGMTVSGEFVGSPTYMSPEQITAGRVPLDHRTDIYSLGATLYELLTLQPPFVGQRRDQVLGQIIHKEPKAPRTVNRKIPQDLETICLKALEKDPDKRYQTAGDLAKDLRAYVSRFAISAHRVGPVGRCIRWAKRSKAMAAALCGLLLLGLLAGALAYRTHRSEQREAELQRKAQEEQRKAQEEKQQQAFEQALAMALLGDSKQATDDIFDAELIGVSKGRIRLLQGLQAWRSENYRKAAEQLQQARALMPPDSVAPIALLAQVYFSDGQWEKWVTMMYQLEDKQPKTPEDFLFKGMNELNDPEKELQDIKSTGRLLHYPVVREQLENAEVNLATDTLDLEILKLALDDAKFAEAALPGDPYTLSYGLWTRLQAAVVYEKTHHPDQQNLMMEKAKTIAEKLGAPDYSESIQCHGARLWYFYLSHKGAALEAEVEESIRLKDHDAWVYKALELLRAGNPQDRQEAVAMARKECTTAFRTSWTEETAAIILAEQNIEVARSLCQEAADWRTGGPEEMAPPLFLRLLGSESKAEKASSALRQRKWPWRDEWNHQLLDFECGKTSPDELMKQAGGSQLNLADADFFVAMTYLANGDRAEAKKHFRAVLENFGYPNSQYTASDLILTLMNQDDTWPPWIPMKGAPATTPGNDGTSAADPKAPATAPAAGAPATTRSFP